MSEAASVATPILALVLGSCALGAVIGCFCRHRFLHAALASFVVSITLLAFLDWTAGRLHWWLERPGEIFIYYLGPYIWLSLAPMATTAFWAGHWFARRTTNI